MALKTTDKTDKEKIMAKNTFFSTSIYRIRLITEKSHAKIEAASKRGTVT